MALSLAQTAGVEELAEGVPLQRERANTLIAGVAGLLQQGISAGHLRPDLDPLIAARAFIGYQQGLALLWLSNPDLFSMREAAPALAAVYVRGVVSSTAIQP